MIHDHIASANDLLTDTLFNSKKLTEKLSDFNFKKSDALVLQNYFSLSIESLSNKKVLNANEFKTKLAGSKYFEQDIKIKNELKTIITKESSKIQKEELLDAINNIIYFGSRYGSKTLINYTDCTNDSLDAYGIKFSVVKLKSSRTKKVLDEYVPSSPKNLKKFISQRMQKFKWGKFDKSSSLIVLPFEEKSLALFLALSEYGTTDQKEFIDAVVELSKNSGGRVQLLDAKKRHKFWKVFSSDITEDDIKGWTSTIEDTTSKIKKGNLSVEEAFYKVLKEKAQNNAFLLKQLESLKSKRCFFK
jgi:hypothetical protein